MLLSAIVGGVFLFLAGFLLGSEQVAFSAVLAIIGSLFVGIAIE